MEYLTHAIKKEKNNLAESLIESVGFSSLSDVSVEASDIALDLLLKDGLFKDIPVIGWLFKSGSAIKSITERLFLKKVALFLYGVGKASLRERKIFKNKLSNDPKYKIKVGENILLLIDRHDRLEKSYMLGQLMSKVITGECTFDLFLRIATALDHSTIEDIKDLYTHTKNIDNLTESVQQNLYKNNLLDMDISAYIISEPYVSISIKYKLNQLGEKIIEFNLLE